MEQKEIVGITIGDAAGIGPEIVCKAMLENEPFACCRPLVIGDAKVLEFYRDKLNLPVRVETVSDIEAHDYRRGVVSVLQVGNLNFCPEMVGQYSADCGKAMLEYAATGIRMCMENRLHAVLGGPHTKKSVDMANIEFHGYPDFVAQQTGAKQAFIMLVAGTLRVCNATLHVAMREACNLISKDLVLTAIREVDDAVQRLGVARPRIAVAGLNPHAGEEGMFGMEEIDEIAPAIQEAQRLGFDVKGPFAGDSLFFRCLEDNKYDAYIGMYHDQAHIALKTLAFENSSGLIIGTPIIFSTVGHGSAFGIAGQNKAFSSSLVATIKLIANMKRR